MKKLLLLLLLSPVASRAQSPFNGGWIIDEDSVQQSEKPKPVTYLVGKGMIHCSDCFGGPEIKANGATRRSMRRATGTQ
jgi:hypothetical protein